jgi:hypothetical protein
MSESSALSSIMPEGMRNASAWLYKPSVHTVQPWMKWAGAALVVFAIVLAVTYYRAMGDIDASIFGFWEVDGDFADSAHLDAMYMYISPPVVTRGGASVGDATQSIGPMGKELSIYVFLKANCEVKFNKSIKAHVSRRTARLDTIQKYTVDFATPVSIIPKRVTAEYDTVTQMLVLKDSAGTYARLFKKPEVSFYCTTASSAVSDKKPSKKMSAPVDDDENSGDMDNDGDTAPVADDHADNDMGDADPSGHVGDTSSSAAADDE